MVTLIPSFPHRQGDIRVFNCFLYSGESFMLYVRLVTLAKGVDDFIVGWWALSFSGGDVLNISLPPFENEIRPFNGEVRFSILSFKRGTLAEQSSWLGDPLAKESNGP
jgi:hypothetical protein